MILPNNKSIVEIADVLHIECTEYLGIPLSVLISRKRDAQTAFIRHIAMYSLWKDGLTYGQIGQLLGDRTAAAVAHGVNRIARILCELKISIGGGREKMGIKGSSDGN